MCSKALNPNAAPFFSNKPQGYFCKRPYYPLHPLCPFPYLLPARVVLYPWQQPNGSNPTTILGLKENVGAATAAKRVPRKSVNGKKRCVSMRLKDPLKKLANAGGSQVVGTRGVAKYVPKNKELQTQKVNTVSFRPMMRRKTTVRNCGGGSGASDADIIPFPGNPDDQKSSIITTIMIKNIPNQLRRCDLLSFLSRHCCEENLYACLNSDPIKSEFDFVYLPMDFTEYWYRKRIANLGYAFVNFTHPVAAVRFYHKFHAKGWDVNQNNKTREITCAKFQGLEALRSNFSSKVFWCHSDEYLPAVVSPPCDGVRLPILVTVGKRVGEPFGNRYYNRVLGTGN